MEVEFLDDELDRLEIDPTAGLDRPQAVVRAYRKCLQFIRAVPDQRGFYAMKSLHFEKLKGKREGDYSMRINQQWRLILRFRNSGGSQLAVVVGIEDYH